MTKELRIDISRNEVFVNGARIHLAPKQYAILVLLREKNKTMSRSDIFKTIWRGRKYIDSCERLVDQHVCRLRSRLGFMAIETVSNYGYRFMAQ